MVKHSNCGSSSPLLPLPPMPPPGQPLLSDFVVISWVQPALLTCPLAFLPGPPVVCTTDEATSALDTRTEREVLGALFNLARGRTSVLVAHRLSTAAQCDKIVVLEQASICGSVCIGMSVGGDGGTWLPGCVAHQIWGSSRAGLAPSPYALCVAV